MAFGECRKGFIGYQVGFVLVEVEGTFSGLLSDRGGISRLPLLCKL